MAPQTIAAYVKVLKPALSKHAFEPARSRLLWMPVHLSLIALCTVAISRHWLGDGVWGGVATLALVPAIGFSLAGLTFLAHETLHGAVVRGKAMRHWVGLLGFLPFVVSPRLWIRWHNQVHHAHANQPGVDPDAYPTLSQYRQSHKEQWVIDHFALGRKRVWGALTLLIGFSFHSAHMLLTARKRSLLSPTEHRLALLESGLGLSFWAALCWGVGPVAFLFVYVLPLLVANAIVMAYILTNHSLSPQTSVNDPLLNSLSVTVPRFADWLTLHFGFHVEHHIFPWMSTRHAREVRRLIKQRWPERYQSMPLFKALWALHRTSRVYKDDVTLIDPKTGKEWKTLAPREKGRSESPSTLSLRSVPPPALQTRYSH